MYLHVLPSHHEHTGCLTLSVHLLCAHCEDQGACFVTISMLLCMCVCRPVCSLCTRAWKHVPVLVMLHSQEHPHCELSIQVRGPLWQVQMTVSWKFCMGSLHARYRTAPYMLRAIRIPPHSITFNPESAYLMFKIERRRDTGLPFWHFYLHFTDGCADQMASWLWMSLSY